MSVVTSDFAVTDDGTIIYLAPAHICVDPRRFHAQTIEAMRVLAALNTAISGDCQAPCRTISVINREDDR